MPQDEFMKQQYLTLRDEIRGSKARVFFILVIGTLFIPIAAFAVKAYGMAFASASIPFILLVLMLAFIMEQNSIVRAGRYLKEHVEPHIPGVVTWENWLESNHKFRDADRYFFGSFLLVLLLFYAIGAGLAVESIAELYPEHYWYSTTSYAVGGLWFLVVWMSHWKMCTRTTA
ncbi:MAG: hypothetical protein H6819_10950 [Phycisphaerales bacterium]|nr:hypothetical protein [Phycisphaerales bacterium]MCB9855597.1 hypothetical protein [Phycisphaerales bacterium]MCB9864914.1 hypothetical protein [Phycisphaerales bacterium]